MVRMDDQGEPTPAPPPEALLIRRHRMAAGVSAQAAADATGGKVSYRRWVQIEQGFTPKGKRRVPTTASDQALAHMAAAVGVKPDQLLSTGRTEAAEVLAVILADRDSDDGRRTRDASIIKMMAEFFEDESVSGDQKRLLAEQFFRILPYYVAGQQPPRELLLTDDDPPVNGGAADAS